MLLELERNTLVLGCPRHFSAAWKSLIQLSRFSSMRISHNSVSNSSRLLEFLRYAYLKVPLTRYGFRKVLYFMFTRRRRGHAHGAKLSAHESAFGDTSAARPASMLGAGFRFGYASITRVFPNPILAPPARGVAKVNLDPGHERYS